MGRPPKNAHAVATTDRLLQAAEQAFGAQGFQQARLADIAAAASVRRSSLLYHFESKEALYAEVVRRAFREMRTVVARAIAAGAGQPPGPALDQLVDSLVAFASARPNLLSVVVRELVDPSGEGQVMRQFGGLIDALEHAFKALVGPETPTGAPLRPAILQIISGYLLRHAAGDLGDALWGTGEHTKVLARALLLGPAPA
ncbi:MAG: TetR/AcrR family transcriptional regulator [Myxococcales bacterium]|nr:TetR/AcrR family transcriptional regulator [Myxococcales bacterium]